MKTVIDLDVELVSAAANMLGTKTKKDTIHAALDASVEAARHNRNNTSFCWMASVRQT